MIYGSCIAYVMDNAGTLARPYIKILRRHVIRGIRRVTICLFVLELSRPLFHESFHAFYPVF